MLKYKTTGYGNRIVEVEVERETESSIWVQGDRRSKRTSYDNYFDTWDEAKEYLMDKAQRNLDSAMVSLKRAQDEFWNVTELRQGL